MALAGGETAQMPGLYQPGTYDLAGTIVGVVEEDEALHGDAVVPGDVLLGYASTGLHTNGYTLARRIVFDRMKLGLDDTLGDDRPAPSPTRCSRCTGATRRACAPVLGRVHALAHITGGGIPGNLVRVLPAGCEAVVDPASGSCRRSSPLLQQAGQISHRARCATSSTSASG